MENEAKLFESVINNMVYDLYFADEMKKTDCFITDEVNSLVVDFDETSEMIFDMYKLFDENKTISKCLIYSRVIGIIKTINGDNK